MRVYFKGVGVLRDTTALRKCWDYKVTMAVVCVGIWTSEHDEIRQCYRTRNKDGRT